MHGMWALGSVARRKLWAHAAAIMPVLPSQTNSLKGALYWGKVYQMWHEDMMLRGCLCASGSENHTYH